MTAALTFQPATTPAPVRSAEPMRAVPPVRPVRAGAVSPETYRRRRLAVVAVVIGLVLGLASFGRQADAGPTAEARSAATVAVVVAPGDTLWTIATSLDPGGDPRALVSELVDLNGAALQPGQEIRVPAELVE